jgi:16S rRNA (guanine527-N7)-methyltransferase
MMLEYNAIHNLTSITDDEGIILKHFLDSVLPYKDIPDNAKVIDIGTGAGFPSIPLLIMNNSLHFVLIDSVEKKLKFVQSVVDEFHFPYVEVIHTRAEDLANKVEYRESFDYTVARAVSALSTLMEYSIPFLKVGGCMLCYKGVGYQDEIDSSSNTFKVLGSTLEGVDEYYVQGLDTNRFVLKIKKNKSTEKKYPRGMNKPRLKPLG